MTEPDPRPEHYREPGWRHEPQREMLDKPMPVWRRYDRWDVALVVTSLCGASLCAWGLLYGMTESMVWLLAGLVMIELGLLSRKAQR